MMHELDQMGSSHPTCLASMGKPPQTSPSISRSPICVPNHSAADPWICRDELEVLYARRASSQHAGASSSSSSSSLSQGAWAGRCVDLGCGTGLMGPLLRQHVSRMEGVDLSGGMVEQVRAWGATLMHCCLLMCPLCTEIIGRVHAMHAVY